jgi:hypothetical protein
VLTTETISLFDTFAALRYSSERKGMYMDLLICFPFRRLNDKKA